MKHTPLLKIDLFAYSKSLMGRHEPWDLEYRAAKATKLILESESNLLEALKDASNMLLSEINSDPPDTSEIEQFIKHIDNVIKKAEQ